MKDVCKNLVISRMAAVLILVWVHTFADCCATTISAVSDHTNNLYKVGEAASFVVTVMKEEQVLTNGTVDVILDNFGSAVQFSNRVDLSRSNPFVVRGALAEPGFLRLKIKGAEIDFDEGMWSVGYEPERIEKGSPTPEDFDVFWREARAKLDREVPLDAKMTLVPERSTSKYDFYRLSFATYGRRVYGYMSMPKDYSRAPYPVVVQVSAAGFGDWTNQMKGDENEIKVFFVVYPWAPHWDWSGLGLRSAYDFMNDSYRRKYGCKGYATAGISTSREDYFFYPVLLGLDRAVNWLAMRSEVDRTRFWYQGTSQGGGFGFYLTGLNRHFTRAAFFVPAMTDVMGYLKGRQSGWPAIVESQREDGRGRAALHAPYFDAANFASRISCPVCIAVGFSDDTCPPCAVYAAYNEIKGTDKRIVHGIGMAHNCFSSVQEEVLDWLRMKP